MTDSRTDNMTDSTTNSMANSATNSMADSATNNPAPLFAVEDLSVSFRRGGTGTTAVSHLDYSIKPREIVGIVGESGSGKSVSMLGSLGLLPQYAQIEAESISWVGKEIKDYTEAQMRSILGQEIAYIYQEPSQSYDPLMNIFKTFREVFKIHKKSMTKQEIIERSVSLLEEVGIFRAEERLFSYFHQFSGGMIQRVQIALALALSPKLLIADEPTTALDVTTQKIVVDLLLDLCKTHKMAMIFITHDLPLVVSMVDRILVMKDGLLVEQGSPNQILYYPQHEYTKNLLAHTIKFGERYHG